MKLFMSYAVKDVDRIKLNTIVDHLDEADYVDKVFFWSRDCQGGKNIMSYMIEGIKASDAVLVFDSTDAANSIPLNQEIAIALAFEKKIIPIFTEQVRHVECLKEIRGMFLRNWNQDAMLDLVDEIYFLVVGKKRHRDLSAMDTLALVVSKNAEMEEKILKLPFFIKILVSGDGGIGKTTYLHRLISDRFFSNTDLTVGIHCHHFCASISDHQNNSIPLGIQFWDAGGQVQFRHLHPDFAKNAHGALLAFALDRVQSYIDASDYLKELRRNDPDLPIMLVGLKADLENPDECVPEPDIKDFVRSHNLIGYVRVSAKTNENIAESIEKLLHGIEDSGRLDIVDLKIRQHAQAKAIEGYQWYSSAEKFPPFILKDIERFQAPKYLDYVKLDGTRIACYSPSTPSNVSGMMLEVVFMLTRRLSLQFDLGEFHSCLIRFNPLVDILIGSHTTQERDGNDVVIALLALEKSILPIIDVGPNVYAGRFFTDDVDSIEKEIERLIQSIKERIPNLASWLCFSPEGLIITSKMENYGGVQEICGSGAALMADATNLVTELYTSSCAKESHLAIIGSDGMIIIQEFGQFLFLAQFKGPLPREIEQIGQIFIE
jgi:small GTP-binding protein